MKKRVLSAMPSQTIAEGALDAAQQTGELSYDGYKKVWSDEFNGDSLNRADWNVETHEKGWANDENVYGQWPRCGEIDCMEVMGQETNKAYGTIHYGNPHSQSQGIYTITDGADFSDDFHIYTCDWEPGKITWYVDGVKYHEESEWHSTTVGQGTLAYPAPFDQPFYIILNLAVGGSWVGNPNDETSFENNPYVIDYVRVYQKDSYDEDVKRPGKISLVMS